MLYKKEGGKTPRIHNLFFTRIEEEAVSNLEKPFSAEEVRNSIMSMKKDKSPGLDGFSMLSFEECWDIVEKDLMKVFAKFYEMGVISK